MAQWESAPVAEETPAWAKAPLADAQPAWANAPEADGGESSEVAEPLLKEAEAKSDLLALKKKAEKSGDYWTGVERRLQNIGEAIQPLRSPITSTAGMIGNIPANLQGKYGPYAPNRELPTSVYQSLTTSGNNYKVPMPPDIGDVIGRDNLEKIGVPKSVLDVKDATKEYVNGLVNFMIGTPAGVAGLAAPGAPAAVKAGIGAAFLTDMVRQSPEQVKELVAAYKEGDVKKGTTAVLGLLTAGAAVGGAAYGVKEHPPADVQTDAQQQLALDRQNLSALNATMPGTARPGEIRAWSAPGSAEAPPSMVQTAPSPIISIDNPALADAVQRINLAKQRSAELSEGGKLPSSGVEYVSVGEKPKALRTTEENLTAGEQQAGREAEKVPVVSESTPLGTVETLLRDRLERRDWLGAVSVLGQLKSETSAKMVNKLLDVGRDKVPLSAGERTIFNQIWDSTVEKMQAQDRATSSSLQNWANDTIKEGQKRMNVGLDPELLAAYAVKGASVIADGASKFADWSEEMLKKHGDEIRPYLRTIYQASQTATKTTDRRNRYASEISENEKGHDQGVRSETRPQNSGGDVEQTSQGHRPDGGPGQTISPPTPSIASSEGNLAMAELNHGISAWTKPGVALRIAAGDTLPKMTAAYRPAAEALASFASAREWGKALGESFALRVLKDSGMDMQTFGALMTEDQLRGTRNDRLARAQAAMAGGDMETAAKMAKAAADVSSIIGPKSPIRTEAEYLELRDDPKVRALMAKHKTMQEAEVDPLHREAAGLLPDAELPASGEASGTHMSLMPLSDEDSGTRPVRAGPGGGNVKASLSKRSRFLTRSGASPRYETDYSAIMQNKFGSEREVIEYNKAVNKMAEGGIAVLGSENPGKIGGVEVKSYPLKYGVLIPKEGGSTFYKKGENIYLPKTLDWEFRGALGIDKPITGPLLLRIINTFLNRSALAGLVDATSHAVNILSTELNRPGMFMPAQLAKAPFRYGKAAILDVMDAVKGSGERRIDQLAQLAKIAESGASRAQFPLGKGGMANPLNWTTAGIHWLDKTYRLMGNDIFEQLVKSGTYADTLTDRREFINQGLQYNRRLQGPLIRAARDLGFSPFVTASRAMNTMVLRNLTLAGPTPISGKARALIISKYVAGFASAGAAVATLNYLATKGNQGGAFGRPGTKLGDVDTGLDDKDGKHITIPLMTLLGYGRTMRELGVTGFVTSKRAGMPTASAMQEAKGNMIDAQLTPWMGPVVQAGFTAATGKSPSAELFPLAPKVGPDEDQIVANMAYAAAHSNPLTGAAYDVKKMGMPLTEAALKQLGRLAPQFGMTTGKAENLAEAVHGSKLNDWIDDVVRRANRYSPNDRFGYAQKEMDKAGIEGADVKKAMDEFRKRFKFAQ